MLNYHDQDLQAIVKAPLTAKEARVKLTQLFAAKQSKLQSDPIWGLNEPFLNQVTLDYTSLLADKLFEAIAAKTEIARDFISRLWVSPVTTQADHSSIVFYLANENSNQELFAIVDPLRPEARLAATNLPTLLQVTAAPDAAQPNAFSDDEMQALSTLIKLLYTADYSFKTVDETVLQPVNGLTFATKFHNGKELTNSLNVAAPGDFAISVPLAGQTVLNYHVMDDEGHDWLDLGTDETQDDTFTWASTTIPEELVGHPLTLQVAVRSDENVPALDELFVIASSNAILMKQTGEGTYELPLPNHASLSVRLNSDSDTITLAYPDENVQVLELNAKYPFVGEWLKAVLPQKRAFN